MKMKTAEEIAEDLAFAAIDMMTLHSPHTQQMMREAIDRWTVWRIRSREIGRLRIPNTEEMVNRFLSWKLPESVMADQCACERTGSLRYGTNLLSADEAREMIYHLHRVVETPVTPGRDEPPHRQGPHDDQCEFRRVKTNRCECYRRRMEREREAAGTDDDKPDGQAENRVLSEPKSVDNHEND